MLIVDVHSFRRQHSRTGPQGEGRAKIGQDTVKRKERREKRDKTEKREKRREKKRMGVVYLATPSFFLSFS